MVLDHGPPPTGVGRKLVAPLITLWDPGGAAIFDSILNVVKGVGKRELMGEPRVTNVGEPLIRKEWETQKGRQ
jgi:hypothetical protein